MKLVNNLLIAVTMAALRKAHHSVKALASRGQTLFDYAPRQDR